MKKARIEIADLAANAVDELSEADLQKVSGGAFDYSIGGVTVPDVVKIPGPPAPFVPVPFPNFSRDGR